MKERTNKDPEIFLVAWKGSLSQLGARFGLPLEKLTHEINQLPKYRQGGKICLDINMPNAPSHLLTLLKRRNVKLAE